MRVHRQLSEVAVREHRAFGPSRRARRVHDRGNRIGGELRHATSQHCAPNLSATILDGLDRLGIQRQHGDILRLRAGRGTHQFRHRDGLSDRHARLRVSEDKGDLLDRRRLVNRNGHQSCTPAGKIQQRPLVARMRHDGDPITEFEPHCNQAGRCALHILVEVRGTHRTPRVPHRELALNNRLAR